MHPHLPHTGESWKVMLIIIAGWSSFACADIFTKTLMQSYSVWQLLTINGFFGILFLGAWIYKARGIEGFKSKNIKWHLIRAATTFFTATCVVSALKTVPLADFYGITFTSPFLMLIMTHFFLHEHIGIQRWISVIIGFIGVIILTGPQFSELGIGIIFSIAAVFFIATGNILVRKIGSKDHIALYGFYPFLSVFLFSLPLSITNFEVPAMNDIPYFTFYTLFLIAGVVLVAFGTAHAREIAAVAPFVYIQIIWGTLFGFFIFGDNVSNTTMIGLILIIGAGLYNIYRERQAKRVLKTD